MLKIFLSLIIFLLLGANLFAQDIIKTFEIVLPKFKVENSLYNKIKFLDSRGDTSLIGIIFPGEPNYRPEKLVLKTPFLPQLTSLLNSLTDSTAKNGEILFQLKQFNFVEPSETRYCYFSIELYAKKNAGYKIISSLDTVILIVRHNVAKEILELGNIILSNFFAKALLQEPIDTTLYNITEIENIDSVEKRKITIYNTTKYVDGLYTNYESFKNLVPDMQGFVEMKKDGTISSVKTLDENGKKIKVKSKNIYAVINKGQIFIATEYGYYPLQKINDNLFFTGDVRVAASNGEMNTAGLALGLLGGISTRAGSKATYDMIIDHRNGKFIHMLAIMNNREE